VAHGIEREHDDHKQDREDTQAQEKKPNALPLVAAFVTTLFGVTYIMHGAILCHAPSDQGTLTLAKSRVFKL